MSTSRDFGEIPQVKLSYAAGVNFSERPKVLRSEDTEKIFRAFWDEGTINHIEEFHIALLNRSNHLIGIQKLSMGGTAGTVVDVKVIMQALLLSGSHSFVMAHNHPSGSLSPSSQDKQVTQVIKKAAELFGITLLDHIILTTGSYYSFADNLIL